MKRDNREHKAIINDRIRAKDVQLIDHTGENVGVVSRDKALRMAEDVGLDLVLLAPKGKDGIPVVKIMDYGKVLYEKKKKAAEAKKHQKVIQVKEVKLRPKIGEHDYQTKMKRAIQFLESGKRVKFTLSFRGREMVTKNERGAELFARIEQSLQDHGFGQPLVHEKDTRMGRTWSRIYYLKS